MHQNLPSDFRRNHIADSIMNFDIFSPRSCRRRNIGSFWETIAETLLWIFNMLVKPLWILVLTTFDNMWMPYIVFEKYLMWLLY